MCLIITLGQVFCPHVIDKRVKVLYLLGCGRVETRAQAFQSLDLSISQRCIASYVWAHTWSCCWLIYCQVWGLQEGQENVIRLGTSVVWPYFKQR